MTESEEKRERLMDLITRWAVNVKVSPMLREGDINGLVQHILEEFYHIRLCCFHLVNDFDEGVELSFKESDGSVISGTYCKECAKWYVKNLKAKAVQHI